jgi:hypothetical protein
VAPRRSRLAARTGNPCQTDIKRTPLDQGDRARTARIVLLRLPHGQAGSRIAGDPPSPARRAHNPEVAGSSPAPATHERPAQRGDSRGSREQDQALSTAGPAHRGNCCPIDARHPHGFARSPGFHPCPSWWPTTASASRSRRYWSGRRVLISPKLSQSRRWLRSRSATTTAGRARGARTRTRP